MLGSMKRFASILLSLAITFGLPVRVLAAAPMAAPSGLSLLEIKITGDEFLVLQNNTGGTISDLSAYWLTMYNNVNPAAPSVSTSTQQLPAVSLSAGQTVLLSSNPASTCGAAVAGKLNVSLTDAGGFLQLTQNVVSSSGITQTASDMVSWSSGASGQIQNVPSSTKDPRAAYYRFQSGLSYPWQLADLDPAVNCQLIPMVAGVGTSPAVTPLKTAATSPPATIVSTTEVDATDPASALLAAHASQMPAADIGLSAPQISELLPNPAGTGNDATDEFIELYNPNDQPFDLSGFVLQTGLTTTRHYTFPAGVVLEPHTFRAFTSEDTGLSLSNTKSQAELIDPLGATISATEVYINAKDGQAWALAGSVWQWTTLPTPGAANKISVPAAVKKKPTTSKKTATTKASSSTKTVKKTAASTAPAKLSSKPAGQIMAPIHWWVLALVAGAAILYAVYEYRRDIIFWLRQHRADLRVRRRHWPAAEGGRGD